MKKIDFNNLSKKLKKPWSPIEITRTNGYHLLLSKFEGAYQFHKHDGDEIFLIVSGDISIEMPKVDKTVNLKEGEGFFLPKGIVHRSVANQTSIVMMFERTNLKTVFVS